MKNKVLIPEGGKYKCVIMENKNTSVFIAGPGSYHKEVVKTARRNNPELEEYRVRGGGRIEIRPFDWDSGLDANKFLPQIRVYGYSVDFGQMNKTTVETLLSEYCNENDLELINQSGEGY